MTSLLTTATMRSTSTGPSGGQGGVGEQGRGEAGTMTFHGSGLVFQNAMSSSPT